MTIQNTVNGTELKIAVGGRLDTTTAPQLDAEIKSNIAGIETLTMDFAELEYISSAGLRVLLAARKIMNDKGKMVILNANETVKEVFEITGFFDMLTII